MRKKTEFFYHFLIFLNFFSLVVSIFVVLVNFCCCSCCFCSCCSYCCCSYCGYCCFCCFAPIKIQCLHLVLQGLLKQMRRKKPLLSPNGVLELFFVFSSERVLLNFLLYVLKRFLFIFFCFFQQNLLMGQILKIDFKHFF